VKFRKHEAPAEMPEFDATNLDLVSTLVHSDLAPSGRGEARRLIEQGGVRVNGVKVGIDHQFEDGQVLSAGKRRFVRIHVK
jgi:tyrosyl-tRNA synthetase